jgi:hypothetical protein
VVTFGVSIERGTVHAVALAGPTGTNGGDTLSERVLIRRRVRVAGGGRRELSTAVGVALDNLADEIGAEHEIAGVAISYRDAAERRSIVAGLASGPWRSASYASAKSAHLVLARAMTWTDEFDHLVICEVTPGCQAFSLISPERDRVVATYTASGTAVTAAAVLAAWDRFDAAGAQPDAVVLIGSAAGASAAAAALDTFGVAIIPCRVAAAATAVGAALAALPESPEADAGRGRFTRGAAAVVATAAVLAGGLFAGGLYEVTGTSRPNMASMLRDARAAAEHHRVHPQVPTSASQVGVEADQPPGAMPVVPGGSGVPGAPAAATDAVTLDPGTRIWGPDGPQPQHGRPGAPSADKPKTLQQEQTDQQPATGSSAMTPALVTSAGVPGPSGLFPGEAAPPPVGTPEFATWWDNHWHLMTQWAAQFMPRT